MKRDTKQTKNDETNENPNLFDLFRHFSFVSCLSSILNNTVISCHPIWQDIVDAGSFNRSAASTEEKKGAALPEKIGVHTVRHCDRIAGSIKSTGRITRIPTQVPRQVAARPLEPLLQQISRFGIAASIRALQCTVNHIEMSITVIVGRPA